MDSWEWTLNPTFEGVVQAVERLGCGVLVEDDEGALHYVNRRILELTGADPTLVRHVEDRAGHDRRYALDDTKLRALGWRPEHSFGEGGLPETVAWYRENRSWWEPIKSGEYRRYYEEQYAERLQA